MSSTVPTNTNGIDSIKQPQLNSHGKLKSYCCRSKYGDGEIGPNGELDLRSNRSSKFSQGDDDEEEMSMAFSNVEVVDTSVSEVEKESEVMPELMPELKELVFTCHHCNIDFKGKPGEFLYRIHMGHHGFNNPFTCNMCGENCENEVGFSMHISKAAH
ncbi:hypothetical protein D910_10130 [Dendroctonus ponderosae]|uniref:C2H2-type domain-containing protein n=1 Tax=Dendroctonus ponderosae TaxID=77166 RepID=U4UIH9_DENPD|nr:hypothetical protein D910_10130 [Dendroctonus ponderosae]